MDDRLNGDGVGLALGINDPAVGWAIGGVATLIWIIYFIAQRDFGDFEDKVRQEQGCSGGVEGVVDIGCEVAAR